MLMRLHNREIFAYELLRGLDVASFPRPKVYYAERMTSVNKHAIIVMDDMSANAVSPGLSYGATREQCFALARHIADFQSYTETRAAEWRGKCDNYLFSSANKDMFDAWFEPTLKCDDASERATNTTIASCSIDGFLQRCERSPSATFAWILLSLAFMLR